jgi:biopolymer transport protein ExbB/TolQ
MKRIFASDLLFQLFALLLALIVVHTVYVSVIWPNADIMLAAEQQRIASGDLTPVPQSIYVIIKDYEQETCFILMLWCVAIMAHKGMAMLAERRLLERALVQVPQGTSILPQDAREYLRPIEALPPEERRGLLPRALIIGLQRFSSTHSIQDVAAAIREVCDSEGERLDSELSMIRYISWAIPSIGFIGTVRGIGMALSQAHRAVEGDIAGVTASLGVAFNSTFVALLISILLMFLMHQLQLQQERLVLDAQAYCDERLLGHLKVTREL